MAARSKKTPRSRRAIAGLFAGRTLSRLLVWLLFRVGALPPRHLSMPSAAGERVSASSRRRETLIYWQIWPITSLNLSNSLMYFSLGHGRPYRLLCRQPHGRADLVPNLGYAVDLVMPTHLRFGIKPLPRHHALHAIQRVRNDHGPLHGTAVAPYRKMRSASLRPRLIQGMPFRTGSAKALHYISLFF